MPSDGPFAIDAQNFPTGPGADFMATTIVPRMAELLDTEPFDSSTGQGSGCAGCHIVQ